MGVGEQKKKEKEKLHLGTSEGVKEAASAATTAAAAGSGPTIAANTNPGAILGALRHISYHVRHF